MSDAAGRVTGFDRLRARVAERGGEKGPAGAAGLLIDGSKLKNHSVSANKLTASAVRSLRGQRGAQGVAGEQGVQGTQGIQGVQGVQGVPGAPGLSGYGPGTNSTLSVVAGAEGTAGAWCPAGKQPLGGGYFSLSAPSTLRSVSSSFAVSDSGQDGWLVTMANDGGTDQSFHVIVRCASVS